MRSKFKKMLRQSQTDVESILWYSFWNNEIIKNLEGILEEILKKLHN